MPEIQTPILGHTKPEVGGSQSIWGNRLNENIDKEEARVLDLGGTLAAGGTAAAFMLSTNAQAPLITGVTFRFRSPIACAAAATLAVNAQLAKPLMMVGKDGTIVPVTAGAIAVGAIIDAVYVSTLSTAGAYLCTSPIELLSDILRRSGGRLDGALSSKVIDHGTKASVTEEFKFSDGNTHTVICAGNLVVNPTGLAEGDVLQVNIKFSSGTIAVSGTTYWEAGGGVKTTTLGDLGVILTAGAAYRMVFEMVAGVRTGILQ